MATSTVKANVITKDFEITIPTSYTAWTVLINTALSGFKPISADFIRNDDLYYLSVTDGVYPSLSITSSGQVQLMGMNTSLRVSEERTIKIRCVYIRG